MYHSTLRNETCGQFWVRISRCFCRSLSPSIRLLHRASFANLVSGKTSRILDGWRKNMADLQTKPQLALLIRRQLLFLLWSNLQVRKLFRSLMALLASCRSYSLLFGIFRNKTYCYLLFKLFTLSADDAPYRSCQLGLDDTIVISLTDGSAYAFSPQVNIWWAEISLFLLPFLQPSQRKSKLRLQFCL